MENSELYKLREIAATLSFTVSVFPRIKNILKSAEGIPADELLSIQMELDLIRRNVNELHEIVYTTQLYKTEPPKKKFFWR